jgi:hypothetical protein
MLEDDRYDESSEISRDGNPRIKFNKEYKKQNYLEKISIY